MKKASLFITGLVVTLSIGLSSLAGFQEQSLNRGDTGGAPARPDYVSFNKGDTGGAPVKPDYASFNRGDTGGAPARPDYVNIGETGGAPANFNKGDGGGISKQDSHADHFKLNNKVKGPHNEVSFLLVVKELTYFKYVTIIVTKQLSLIAVINIF